MSNSKGRVRLGAILRVLGDLEDSDSARKVITDEKKPTVWFSRDECISSLRMFSELMTIEVSD